MSPPVQVLGDIRLVSESERKVARAQEIWPLQVGILYDNGPVMLVANIVNAALVTAILGSELGRTAYLWCAAVIVVAVARAVLSLAYRRRHLALPVPRSYASSSRQSNTRKV